ncbi:unnamed protein product, partial [Adineta steineri]
MGNTSMTTPSNRINVKPRPSVVDPVTHEPSHTSPRSPQYYANSSTIVDMKPKRSLQLPNMLDNVPMIKQNLEEQDRAMWRQ